MEEKGESRSREEDGRCLGRAGVRNGAGTEASMTMVCVGKRGEDKDNEEKLGELQKVAVVVCLRCQDGGKWYVKEGHSCF